jgi:hypothetical protein
MLSLKTIWQDIDLIECLVEARGEAFAGAAKLYFTDDLLREFANEIRGFPSSPKDERLFETTNRPGGNEFKIRLNAEGASVRLVNAEDGGESATVNFRVEGWAIDRFEQHLLHLAKTRSGTAQLTTRSN